MRLNPKFKVKSIKTLLKRRSFEKYFFDYVAPRKEKVKKKKGASLMQKKKKNNGENQKHLLTAT